MQCSLGALIDGFLISLGALVSDGSRCILDKDRLVVTNGFQVVMKSKKKGSLYELVGSMDEGWHGQKVLCCPTSIIFLCGI